MLSWGLHEYLKLASEFRTENLIDEPWMTDVVQTKVTAFHTYINIRSQLASMKAMEVDGDQAASTVDYDYVPPSVDDSSHLDPLSPESPLPDAFVPDIEQSQQTQQWDTGMDKKEKNRRNRELKRARMRAKQLQKTLEPFNCPWCSVDSACSLFILKHVYVFKWISMSKITFLTKSCSSERVHSFKTKLSKSQMKALKCAHQAELHQKLQALSISERAPMGSSFHHNWDGI